MSTLLEQASLVMIPSGYKEDVVYSQIPTNGNGDLSFTRASNGTRVNSAGLVEVVAWNLLQYSEDFSNGVWVKTSTTVSTNTTTAPNGTTTADSLLETTANATHQLWERPEMVAGQTFTQSCYIKTNGRNRVQLQIFDSSAIYVSALFDVVSGTIIATNGTSSIESVGNGWYRCIVSGVCPTSTIGYCVINLATDSYTQSTAQDAYAGDASKGVFIWGAQLNIGSTAKPYFPTTDRLNVPRLTYQNGGGGCPSLLLEKQSTNLVSYSQDFGNAYWSKGGATITANATTSPDGTQDADKIAENTTSTTTHYINKGFTLSATNYTLSVFAKASERKWIFLIATTSADVGAFFDLENGVVGNVSSGYSASIENFGNGWYRCNLTFTATAATWYINYLTATANNTYNYAGTIGSGIFVYGAQLEASSYPTSYIPTTSSSATRVADACFKTGISSLIGQTEGTLFIDVSGPSKTGDARYIGVSNGTDTNRILFYSSNLTTVSLYWQSPSGSGQLNFTAINGRMKMAATYKNNDFVVYCNGVLQSSTTSAPISMTLNTLFVGTYEDTTIPNSLDQSVNEAIIFPTRLTNAELASLTTI